MCVPARIEHAKPSIRYRSLKAPFWVTASGEEIALALMPSDHIRNAANYLRVGTGEYGPMLRPGCSGFTNAEWLHLFSAELARRSRFGAS
jgi:hypothetical protein